VRLNQRSEVERRDAPTRSAIVAWIATARSCASARPTAPTGRWRNAARDERVDLTDRLDVVGSAASGGASRPRATSTSRARSCPCSRELTR